MFSMSSSGDSNKMQNSLRKILRGDIFADLDKYGQMGVEALAKATPVRSGLTSQSWGYRVIRSRRNPGIEWFSSSLDTAGGTPVAILIQYGHATGTGGYVPGIDFINPVMKPIFDQIVDDVWERVKQ